MNIDKISVETFVDFTKPIPRIVKISKKSIEIPIILSGKLFYIRDSLDNLYTIPIEYLIHCKYFFDSIKYHLTENNALLLFTKQYKTILGELYQLDSPNIVKFIVDYLIEWRGCKLADYLPLDVIQTDNIIHMLNIRDINLIETYLKNIGWSCTDIDIKFPDTSTIMKKYLLIQQLSLLQIASVQYKIPSLNSKIMVYINALLWNCSTIDINEIESSDVYKLYESIQHQKI